MSDDVIVTINHARRAGLCVNGARAWFDRHGLDFRAFLREGIAASKLLATGDAMAAKAVEHAMRDATASEERS
ncbi:MAG: hypothetical protein ACK4J1_03595 [Hylemonella sp.]